MIPGEEWQRQPSDIHHGWRYTIKTGHHRDDDVRDEDVPAIRDAVVAAVKQARDYGRPSLAGIELRSIVEEFAAVDTVEDFDDILSELYDWGDLYRVIVKGDASTEPRCPYPDVEGHTGTYYGDTDARER